jgi:hypothetical protein
VGYLLLWPLFGLLGIGIEVRLVMADAATNVSRVEVSTLARDRPALLAGFLGFALVAGPLYLAILLAQVHLVHGWREFLRILIWNPRKTGKRK